MSYDQLIDVMVSLAQRDKKLLTDPIREINGWEATSGDTFVVQTEAEGILSRLIGAALIALSQEVHPEEDRVVVQKNAHKMKLTPEQAHQLIRMYSGVRKAARVTGLSASTLSRAKRRYEKDLRN